MPVSSRTSPPGSEAASVRRRRRLALACTECRRRKVACDRGNPCNNCAVRKSVCVYRGAPARGSSGVPPPTLSATGSEHRRMTDVLPGTVRSEPETFSTAETAVHESRTSGSDIIGHKVLLGHGDKSSRIFSRGPAKPGSRFTKSRLFGRSHWMNKLYQFVEIHRLCYSSYLDDTSEVYKLQDKCKRLARALKGPHSMAPTGRGIIDADIKSLIPSKEICDQLLALYFRTFNSVYRVLHRPTFEKEVDAYWANINVTDDIFVTKFLLALAIGTTFYTGPDAQSVRTALRSVASDVVLASQTWQCVPLSKHALTEDTIQIFVLVLLARQNKSVLAGGDNVWSSAGALLQTAIMMGLHRDPTHLCHISTFWGEMRRRLWWAILEIIAQTGIDYGQLPMLASEEWDTEIPANIDDEELTENMMFRPASRPFDEVWTQSSVQCALGRSLPLRLRIVKTLNGLQSNLSYEETLHIGKELADHCRANNRLLEACRRSCNGTDELSHGFFQLKLLDTLTRRFLLALHTPFARESRDDPTYYFSRHTCVDSALKLLTYIPPAQKSTSLGTNSSTGIDHLSGSPITTQDDYTLLKLRSRGTFRAILSDSSIMLLLELSQQLVEDPSPPLFGLSSGLDSMPAVRRELYDTVKAVVEIQRERIWAGETNIRSFVFVSTALTIIDWMIRNCGTDAIRDSNSEESLREEITRIQKESLEESWKILKKLKTEKDDRNAARKGDGDLARAGDLGDQTMDIQDHNEDKSSEPDTEGLWDESFSDIERGVEDPLESFFQNRSGLSGDSLGPWFYTDLDSEIIQF
ncbi:hypothetical protein F4677DRAFT_432736 [Hypoxylon crocopeplum]|nr:hypothetical protein F4677DRAFT_432736 [Hypoxylon crocopeplum]